MCVDLGAVYIGLQEVYGAAWWWLCIATYRGTSVRGLLGLCIPM